MKKSLFAIITDMKKLYRSKANRVFAGVCGGLGDYFGVDPVMVRLLWVVVSFFTALIPGVLAYIIASIIVPMELSQTPYTSTPDSKS